VKAGYKDGASTKGEEIKGINKNGKTRGKKRKGKANLTIYF